VATAEHVTAIFIDVCVFIKQTQSLTSVSLAIVRRRNKRQDNGAHYIWSRTLNTNAPPGNVNIFRFAPVGKAFTLSREKNSHMLSREIQLSVQGNWTHVILFHIVRASRLLHCIYCFITTEDVCFVLFRVVNKQSNSLTVVCRLWTTCSLIIGLSYGTRKKTEDTRKKCGCPHVYVSSNPCKAVKVEL
jgi:hypothetical protein